MARREVTTSDTALVLLRDREDPAQQGKQPVQGAVMRAPRGRGIIEAGEAPRMDTISQRIDDGFYTGDDVNARVVERLLKYFRSRAKQ
jgi:hypothetical protein